MAKLTILEFPDPRLRTRSVPVETFDAALQQLIGDMFETMYAAPGIGLAATQVDVHKQVLVLDVSESKDQPMVFVNPRIVERDGEQVYQEGCLSVPGIYADVVRANRVRVQALNGQGESFEIEADGLLAICIQHEMDHLEGRVFVEKLSRLKQNRILSRLKKQGRRQPEPDARRLAL